MINLAYEQGTRLRAEVEGTYVYTDTQGRHVLAVDGGEYYLPTDAAVEVVSPPLPPEPPINTVVRDASGQVWINPVPGHWRSITGERMVATWGDLWGLNGPVVRLVPEDQTSGYVPAMTNRRVLWMHSCGTTERYPVIGCRSGFDPNNPPAGTPHHLYDECGDDCPDLGSRWVLLHVQTERSDG